VLTELRRAQQNGASELEMAKLLAEAELVARKFEDVLQHHDYAATEKAYQKMAAAGPAEYRCS